ncbi:hypothetical protein ACLBWS_03665 [Brucellaceae bacterium D45D]
MANDLIEKAAKAIYERRNGRGCKPWAHLPKTHQEPYLDDAEAAAKVIRAEIAEPNEAMLDAYWHQAGESKEMRSRTHISERRYWQVMFDASPIGSGKK